MDANLSWYRAGDAALTTAPSAAGAGERRAEKTPPGFSLCRIGATMMLGVMLGGLVACSSRPGGGTQGIDQAIPQPTTAIAHPLDREPGITVADDPRTLAERAEEVPANQAAALLLRAIAGSIRLGQFTAAQTLVARLYGKQMTAPQQDVLIIEQAHLAQGLGQHAQAIALLREIEQSPAVNAETKADLLLLQADSQQALGHTDGAVATLLRRDKLLKFPARLANQKRILALIDSLDPLGQLLLQKNTSDPPIDKAIHNAIIGWLALSEALKSAPIEARMAALQQWRARYRQHSVEQRLLNQPLAADGSAQYQHIAILLPLTSPFGKAAQAFYDGFMAARRDDVTGRQPKVSLYDIGEDPSLVSVYAQAAVNAGADFVVGPLGRRAVNALLSGPPSRLPVLLIGTIPEDKSAPDLYGISLSPEQEAKQAAARAFADGHRQAGIFRSGSLWGQRVATAFMSQWEALGGTLVDDKSFPGNLSDYAPIIRKLLGLDKSIVRERILRAQLDIDLEFTPRRRDDMDFLFLAANADQARQLVPQLRFFQAHDLALYATSYVYSGKPDPAIDADLDGIIFGDMDWILDAAVLPEPAPVPESEPDLTAETALASAFEPGLESEADAQSEGETAAGDDSVDEAVDAPAVKLDEWPHPASAPGREPGPYYHTDLDRLYALGLDSYPLIPRLKALRNNQWQQYFGKAVDFSVKADGNIWRHLIWARFDRGLPQPLPEMTAVDFSIPAPTPAPIPDPAR